MSKVIPQPDWPDSDEAANVERNGYLAREVVIGKLLAGTTLTQALIDEMMAAYVRGEPVRTWMDVDVLKVERVKDYYLPAPKPE